MKDYFSFTRRDRIGIIVLVLMIVFVAFVPALINRNRPSRFTNSDSSWVVEIEKLKQNAKDREKKFEDNRFNRPVYPENNKRSFAGELFSFDPNTATADELKKLGLRDNLIQTIIRYREKGGKFKKPEDIEKIYGIHKDESERLMPYVKISPLIDSLNRRKPFADTGFMNLAPSSKYKYEYEPVEINSSDSTEWIALPGIGSKLSKRIIDFRERLGGFISIDQVGETFGLPDSTFQKIKPLLFFENSNLRKININSVTMDQLKTHPYLRWSIANAIIAYREMHGPYKSVEEIKMVMAVTDKIFEKIAPYLTVD